MAAATILGSDAGRILLDFSKARLLAPFMQQAMTVPQAAACTHTSPSALAYWVKRFVTLGLLVQVSEQRPYTYRAVSREFLVDLRRTAPMDTVIRQMNQPGHDRLMHSVTQEYRRVSDDWVLRMYVDERSLLRRELTPAPNGGPALTSEEVKKLVPLDTFGLIRLSRRQAQQLSEALTRAVMEAFQESSEDERDDNYFLHIALTRDTPTE